jgi:hypothetical protein
VTVVLTACSNRKRRPVSKALQVAALRSASLELLADNWTKRLEASLPDCEAATLYGGRGFQEAAGAAAQMGGEHFIISAGLGLIPVTARIPAYSCTVIAGAPDSVLSKTSQAIAPADWWREIQSRSPFAWSIERAAAAAAGPICVALSETYIAMIGDDLANLPLTGRERLRLFTRAPIARIAAPLRPFVMPYDDRLDGAASPLPGTKSDFAARALAHFATAIFQNNDERDAGAHCVAINQALADWPLADRPIRERHGDEVLLSIMRTHWDRLGGSSTRLLRELRQNLNIACEQGRFAALARIVRAERVV